MSGATFKPSVFRCSSRRVPYASPAKRWTELVSRCHVDERKRFRGSRNSDNLALFLFYTNQIKIKTHYSWVVTALLLIGYFTKFDGVVQEISNFRPCLQILCFMFCVMRTCDDTQSTWRTNSHTERYHPFHAINADGSALMDRTRSFPDWYSYYGCKCKQCRVHNIDIEYSWQLPCIGWLSVDLQRPNLNLDIYSGIYFAWDRISRTEMDSEQKRDKGIGSMRTLELENQPRF
jgi:hypothetical protein